MTKAQEVGARIAQARREKGVREKADVRPVDVARALGVSQATVSDWEAGKTTPRETDGTMQQLAAFLGVTPEYLRYGVGDAAAVLDLSHAKPVSAAGKARAMPIADREREKAAQPAKKRTTKRGGGSGAA